MNGSHVFLLSYGGLQKFGIQHRTALGNKKSGRNMTIEILHIATSAMLAACSCDTQAASNTA
ncbi:hypothetical protein [Paraburkholderia sp. BL23I1N1]|uniref:hypothetical protein n=1 Tax=Paraburkholderia sp. BL23I1N1 TaxID=1938802 RepID=UPI0011C348BA|nr:hypothetical protein [Paraburkholderia sp. BL23I1N1]